MTIQKFSANVMSRNEILNNKIFLDITLFYIVFGLIGNHLLVCKRKRKRFYNG